MEVTQNVAARHCVRRPLCPRHIGAEIRGLDLREQLDEPAIQRIQQAWLDHSVLLVRGQTLSQEDLAARHRLFRPGGRIGPPGEVLSRGYLRLLPNIMMISNIRENGETIGALPDGEMMFHHDMIHARCCTTARCCTRLRFHLRRRYAVRLRLCRL